MFYMSFTKTRKLLDALVSKPEDFLALSLFEATDGPGTNDDVLIEIICARRLNKEIQEIKEAYRKSKLSTDNIKINDEKFLRLSFLHVVVTDAEKWKSPRISHEK